MSKQQQLIKVEGINIAVYENDYISLTDIAKQSDKRAAVLITSWLKNSSTLRFLQKWEELHNPDFKVHQMVHFRLNATDNQYVPTPKKYIKETNAIGLISKAGRYGGTFAHQDIALNFCYWLSPEFQVYMIKEFQRLKSEEADRRGLEWTIEKLMQNHQDSGILLETLMQRLQIGKTDDK